MTIVQVGVPTGHTHRRGRRCVRPSRGPLYIWLGIFGRGAAPCWSTAIPVPIRNKHRLPYQCAYYGITLYEWLTPLFIRGRNAFQACAYQFNTVDGGTRCRPARIIFVRYMLQRPRSVLIVVRSRLRTGTGHTDTQTHTHTDRHLQINIVGFIVRVVQYCNYK